ncbi:MAG: hypothetical protein FD135_4958, partial [Comamonadaceae bacterium]
EKWNDYQQAICDMVERTSTGDAPWTLVEANDKNYARVKILRTLCQSLEAALDRKPETKPAQALKSDQPVDQKSKKSKRKAASGK